MEGTSKEESLSVLTAIITTRMTGGHQEYLRYYKRDASKFVVMKNETYHHPRRGHRSRKYMWSCAMTGIHCLKAYHHLYKCAVHTRRCFS